MFWICMQKYKLYNNTQPKDNVDETFFKQGLVFAGFEPLSVIFRCWE